MFKQPDAQAQKRDELPDAHIPTDLNGPLLQMTAMDAGIGNIPTIFVGVVTGKMYTDETWNRHKARIASLFSISHDWCYDVRVSGLGPSESIVDVGKLQQEMRTALAAINKVKNEDNEIINVIRIVGLGVGSSAAITEAIEALLRGWKIPPENKRVQFIALGESPDFHYLNFCKSICMKRLCGTLQYYNTMDYSPFGYLRSEGLTSGNGQQAGCAHQVPPALLQRLLGQMELLDAVKAADI